MPEMRDVRVYPYCCLSAQCGRTSCPADCPRLPVLQEFKRWVEKNDAQVADEIWCPTVYVATKGGE